MVTMVTNPESSTKLTNEMPRPSHKRRAFGLVRGIHEGKVQKRVGEDFRSFVNDFGVCFWSHAAFESIFLSE